VQHRHLGAVSERDAAELHVSLRLFQDERIGPVRRFLGLIHDLEHPFGARDRGQLALDNAVSVEAARHKGITGDLAGRADILVAPNIEAANILYKALIFFAHAEEAGIVMGARAPIVLASRSDSVRNKLYSMALGALAR
jgi:phosphotransacetylase